jgi:hypothetical protein
LDRTERFAKTLVGQREADALHAAEALGITVGIAGRDGRLFPLRTDMRFSRVNLVIDDGIVTQARAS